MRFVSPIGFFALFAVTTLLAGSAPASQSRENVLYSFQGAPDGQQPWDTLIADEHGNLFGTTNLGGTGSCNGTYGGGCGTVFELSPQKNGGWSESILYSFQAGSDGANPQAALVMDRKGNLYGVTSQGGTGNCGNLNLIGCGTVFELSPQGNGVWRESVVYSFQGVPSGNGNGDAARPNTLTFGPSGALVGVSSQGGTCTAGGQSTYCNGAAFELKKNDDGWNEKIIYRADVSDTSPASAIFDANGNLYSVSAFGGPDNVGEVFVLTPPSGKGLWTKNAVYDFQNQNDGALPVPGLVFNAQGNLFGASVGTDSVAGNVFELTPSTGGKWTESVLFSFEGKNGSFPSQGPILDANGKLLGATTTGGTRQFGVGYMGLQKSGAWKEKVLHDFANGSDGSEPLGGLVIGRGGALYGTTVFGGSGNCTDGCGTVFRIAQPGIVRLP